MLLPEETADEPDYGPFPDPDDLEEYNRLEGDDYKDEDSAF
jgi:hypothetical protein